MSKHSLARRSLVTAVGGLAALTLMGSSAHAAEATTSVKAPTTASAAASSSPTAYVLPSYGSRAIMPTWFFGGTRLCAFNYGTSWGQLKVQSVNGAAPEYINVAPFQQNCINRWWWGVPVWTTNQSFSPLYVSGS